MLKGKLIVIEGTDSSGKTVQAKLLVKALKKRMIPIKYFDFPQYYDSFHGKTVAKFLRGEFGNIDAVSPYLASLAFALDRASVKKEMEGFLNNGGFIVANRYATSNMAYQAAKFTDPKKRNDFLKWVYELEYKVNRIPKEDLVIYLDVPLKIRERLFQKKGNKDYLQGQKDIHEADLNYQQEVEKMYQYLMKKYQHWKKIDCTNDQQLSSPEAINQKVISLITPYLPDSHG